MSKDKRAELLTSMGVYTEVSVAYAKRLLALEVKESSDMTLLPSILYPWAPEGEGSGANNQQFNLVSPKLSALMCSPGAKIEIVGKLLVEDLIVGLIMGGKKNQEQLAQLSEILMDGLPPADMRKKLPKEYTDLADNIASACAGFAILTNPSPTAVSSCLTELKNVRNMITGMGGLFAPWSLISEALEESAYWQPLKVDFRQTLTSEYSIGKEMEQAFNLLRGDGGDTIDAIKTVCDKLPGWVARARNKGTQGLQELLAQKFEKAIAALGAEGDDDKLKHAQVLDAAATSVSMTAYKEPQPLRVRMLEIKKLLRRVCEESNKSITEVAFLKKLQAFTESKDFASWDAASDDVDGVVGVKFSVPAHVVVLRESLAQGVALLGEPVKKTEAAGEGARDDAVVAENMTKRVQTALTLYGMIAEPTEDDKAKRLHLQYLDACWKMFGAATALIQKQGQAKGEEEGECHAEWSSLRACLEKVDRMGQATEDTRGTGDEELAEVKKTFEGMVREARAAKDEYAMNMVTMVMEKLADERDRLQVCGGGVRDGGLWKQDYLGQDWAAVLATA